MDKFSITTFTLSFMILVSVAHADTQTLAMEKQCFSCHTLFVHKSIAILVNKAPDFESIAERYKGQTNVEARLAQKIKNGGIDHWGSTPMPSLEGNRPNVSEAEAMELAAWILEQH